MPSPRETVLLVRAVNQASGPIRRISSDLIRMGQASEYATKGGFFSRPRVRQIQQDMRSAGHVMTLFGGAALAGFAVAANAAANFEQRMTLAATQTSRTVAQTNRNARYLTTQAIKQLQRFPAAADDVAKSFYDIYSSLNINLGSGVKLMNIFQRAAVGGMAPLNDVTQAGITVMNTFGLTTKTVTPAINRMFAAVRFGRMTFQQLTQAMSMIVPAAKQQHQSLDSMLGAYAFLTRVFGNTSRAATSYSRAIELLNRQKFVENVRKQGVELRDSQNHLLPLIEVIRRISPLVKKSGGDIANFFKDMSGTEGTIQARRAITFLIDRYGLYSKVLKQTTQDNNEFGKSFRAMRGTDAVRWQIFLNNLRAFVLLIGQQAIPILLQITKPIQNLINWFSKLDKSTQQQYIRWAIWGAAIITAGGVVLTFASAVGGLMILLAPLAGTLTTLAIGFSVVTAAVLALSLLLGSGTLFGAMTSDFGKAAITIVALTIGISKFAGIIKSLWGLLKLQMIAGLGFDLMAAREAFLVASVGAGVFESALIGLRMAATALLSTFWPLGLALAAYGVYLLATHGSSQQVNADTKALISTANTAIAVINGLAGAFRGLAGAAKTVHGAELDHAEAVANLTLAHKALHDTIKSAKADKIVTPAERAQINLARIAVLRLNDQVASTKNVLDAQRKNFTNLRLVAEHAFDPAYVKPLHDTMDKLDRRIATLRGRIAALPPTQRLPAIVEPIQAQIAALLPKQREVAGKIQALYQNAYGDIAKYIKSVLPNANQETLALIGQQIRKSGHIFTPKELRIRVKSADFQNTLRDFKRVESATKQFTGRVNYAKIGITPSGTKLARMAAGLGRNIQQGVVSGAAGLERALAIQLIDQISGSMQAARRAYGMHSPSAVFAKMIGEPIGMGIVKGILDTKDSMRSAIDSAVSNMLSKWDEMHSTFESAFGDLFQFGPGIDAMTSSLRIGTQAFAKYMKDINNLRKRHAPQSLIDTILGMGAEGAQYASSLAGASRKQLAQYLRLYNRQQRMINSATNKEFKNQIALWKKQGDAVALGFMQGIIDHQPKMIRMMRAIFGSLLLATKKANQSHSPSRLYMKEGQNIMRGLELGLLSYKTLKIPQPVIAVGLHRAAMSSGSVVNYNTTYNVHQARDESLMSTLRKHDFVTRKRR